MPTISQLLANKLIPWSDNAASRIIVGNARMKASAMPGGVCLEKRPLSGKRIIVKNQRIYRNTRALAASWPDCGLNEVNAPKLACVLSGYVDFQLGAHAVLCGPGHFIFIPPNLPHPDGSRNITNTTKSTFCEILYFLPQPDVLQCWFSRYEAKSPSLRNIENYLITHRHVTELFQILTEEIASNGSKQMGLNGKLLQSFLCIFQREIDAENFQEVPHHYEREATLYNLQSEEGFMAHLHQYIQSHLHDRPSLDDAARNAYLSRAQFTRRVRAETGKSFVELLNEHRIETAKNLLGDSDWTVNVIATFVGYRTPHYFQDLFRRKTGLTPNSYRQSVRKK
jgi:AraC-like DNA-binding protein